MASQETSGAQDSMPVSEPLSLHLSHHLRPITNTHSMQNNAITWTEIPVTDMSRATEFYKTVFGWDCSAFGAASIEEAGFVMFNATGKPDGHNGGFVKICPEKLLSPALHPDNASKERMSVRVTISVASIDEKLKEIEKAGGAMYSEKGAIPGENMGFVAKFTDTEMNVMGLWSMK